MIKKIDIIIIGIIITCCFVLSIIFYAQPFEGEPVVNVYIDGKKYDSMLLSEDTELLIDTPYGLNGLLISENMAMISESNCSTKSCMSKGVISRPGSMIVCAPHHLVIKIETVDQGNSQ